jgi:hypothetical protein
MRIPTGIDIVLTCTFKFRKKIGSKNKQSLFKCIIQPDWSADDPFKASFSFEIPENIPSYFKDDVSKNKLFSLRYLYNTTKLPFLGN